MMQPPSGEWLYLDTPAPTAVGVSPTPSLRPIAQGCGCLPHQDGGQVGAGRKGEGGPTLTWGWRRGPSGNDEPPPSQGDHTFADSYITVLPKGTEFVVFSIDGPSLPACPSWAATPKCGLGLWTGG